MLDRFLFDMGDLKLVVGALVGAIVTALIGVLVHRRTTRQLRASVLQAEAEAQNAFRELHDCNDRLAQQELANDMARLDVLRLIEQLGKESAPSEAQPAASRGSANGDDLKS